MAQFTNTQYSFTTGELAPELWGRTDLDKHHNGLALASNILLREQGAATTRPGMIYLETLKDTQGVYFAKFLFSPTDKYLIVFGNGYIRIVNSKGYVKREDGTIYEIPSPYTAEDLKKIRYDQSGDVIFIAKEGLQPRTLTRYSETEWRLETYKNENGPFETYNGDLAFLSLENNRLLLTQTSGYQFSTEDVGGYFKLEKDFEAQSISFTQSNATTAQTLLSKVFLCCGSWQLDSTGTWTGTVKLEQSDDGVNWKAYRSYSATNTANINSSGEISNTLRFLRLNCTTWTSGTVYLQFRVNSFTYNLYGTIASHKSASQAYVELDNAPATSYSTLAGKISFVDYTLPTMTSNNTPSGKAFYVRPNYTGAVQNEDGTTATTYDLAYKAFDNNVETGAILPVFYYADGVRLGYEFDSHKSFDTITLNMEPPQEGHTINVTAWAYSKTSGWKRAGTKPVTHGDPRTLSFSFDTVIADGIGISIRELDYTQTASHETTTIYSLGCNAKDVSMEGDELKFFAPLWGKRQGWPSAVAFFQSRLGWFSGYKGNLTKTDDFYNFAVNISVKDDDAISSNLKSAGMSTIRHAIGAKKLLILTDGGEYVNSSDIVTPASSGFLQQSNYGSNYVRPVMVGPTILFVHLMGGRLYNYNYNFDSDNYSAQDLCALAPHLFEGRTIVQIDYQSAPTGIVWVVLDNGQLLSLTYAQEHGVIGWTRHNTEGQILSVCCLPGGTENEVYLAVKRGDKITIELLASQLPLTNRKDAFCVDCGLTKEYAEPTLVVDGLEHLEGKEVAILADGNVVRPQVVRAGTVQLPIEAKKITVGLPLVWKIETLPQFVGGSNGEATSKLRPHSLRVRVKQSAGGKISMDPLNSDPLVYGEDGELFTGEVRANLRSVHDEHPQICFEGREPLPFNLTKLTVEY